ncbi:putative RNA recognition motif domain, nucleotide-binding alpha-beta plait domain superfamily [Helianthus annuus]|nr:putative RNA recognition motif domain, nucleotide-binding alpha-beta plait domain superfamily [Helianthus annuus]
MNGHFEGEEEQPWNQAIGKRTKKNQKKNFKKQSFEFEYATTFFVSNLPGFCTRGEIWNEFRVFGELADVFLPKKLDKGGNRFAFVRYDNVQDVEKMLEVLNKVKLKGAKLKVDMAKFRRDGKPTVVGIPRQYETAKANQSCQFHNHTNASSGREWKHVWIGLLGYALTGSLFMHGIMMSLMQLLAPLVLSSHPLWLVVWITEVMRDWIPDFMVGGTDGPKKQGTKTSVVAGVDTRTHVDKTGRSVEVVTSDVMSDIPVENEKSNRGNDTCMGVDSQETAPSSSIKNPSYSVPDIEMPCQTIFNAFTPGGSQPPTTHNKPKRNGSGSRVHKPISSSSGPNISPRQPANKRARCESISAHAPFSFPLPPYPDYLRANVINSPIPSDMNHQAPCHIVADCRTTPVPQPSNTQDPVNNMSLGQDNYIEPVMDTVSDPVSSHDLGDASRTPVETRATIEIGKAIGLQVDNFMNLVEEMVRGEGVNIGNQ